MLADVAALARAVFDPEAPWIARVLVFLIVAYVLSPVDLIPDFIPVLGWLDELVLVPLALRLALRLMPPALLARYRDAPVVRTPAAMGVAGAIMVGGIWIGIILMAVVLLNN